MPVRCSFTLKNPKPLTKNCLVCVSWLLKIVMTVKHSLGLSQIHWGLWSYWKYVIFSKTQCAVLPIAPVKSISKMTSYMLFINFQFCKLHYKLLFYFLNFCSLLFPFLKEAIVYKFNIIMHSLEGFLHLLKKRSYALVYVLYVSTIQQFIRICQYISICSEWWKNINMW